eukprot:5512889-Prymnesium_polylepis.2
MAEDEAELVALSKRGAAGRPLQMTDVIEMSVQAATVKISVSASNEALPLSLDARLAHLEHLPIARLWRKRASQQVRAHLLSTPKLSSPPRSTIAYSDLGFRGFSDNVHCARICAQFDAASPLPLLAEPKSVKATMVSASIFSRMAITDLVCMCAHAVARAHWLVCTNSATGPGKASCVFECGGG